MQGGDLFLNRIGEKHPVFSSREAPVRFYYLGFLPDESEPEEKYFKIRDVLEHSSDSVVHKVTSIQQPFAHLLGEIYCNDTFSVVLVESYIHQILSAACHSPVSHSSYSYPADKSSHSDEGSMHAVF